MPSSYSPAGWFARFLRWGFSALVLREQAAPYAAQDRAYRRIRARLAGTEVARRTALMAAPDLGAFAASVPAHDYEFFKDLIDRVADGGERDLLFHGAPVFVGLCSGTSGSGIKRVVYERHILRTFDSWERSLGAIIAAHSSYNPLIHNRLVWGTTPPSATRSASGIEQGYLSCLMAKHRIRLLRDRTFPSVAVSHISDMKEKIRAAARELRGTQIHLASSMPSYLLNLLEELRADWGVRDFAATWPQLDVVLYSGSYIDPYRAQLGRLLGHPVTFIGMYLSTEGPIGYEIPSLQGGVSGLFSFHLSDLVYTFRRLGGDGRILTVADLCAGDEVELLLTTPNGLINYRVGDCLRIHSTQPLLFEIAGRVGHGINIVGEKMSLAQLSRAAVQAAADLPTPMRHYFVCPGTSASGRSYYEWTLLVDHPEAVQESVAIAALDRALMDVNPDYQEERAEQGPLDAPQVTLLHSAVAQRYFERDAHRGQFKMKTAFDTREKLQAFLRELGIDQEPRSA